MSRALSIAAGAGALGVLGYLFYRGTRPASAATSRLAGTPLPGGTTDSPGFARFEVAPSGTKWRVIALSQPTNMMPAKGQRYMARVKSEGMFLKDVVVEGTLEGTLANTLPMTLRVTRVVAAPPDVQVPSVPFSLNLPPGDNINFHPYIEPTRWTSLHASSVSEDPNEKIPPVGARVKYAMRESNPMGNAVVVIEGRVMSVDHDEEEIVVSADDVSRVIRGDRNVGLPGTFTIPMENLVAS